MLDSKAGSDNQIKTPSHSKQRQKKEGNKNMSLLQELKRDTKTLLNTTGATREQLETFLKVTNTDLGEILYSESKYNQFIKWLQHHEEIETGLMFVNIAMVNYLMDKYNKGQSFTKDEKLNCYAYDKTSRKYISCINSNGDCFIYEYNNIKELKLDLIY